MHARREQRNLGRVSSHLEDILVVDGRGLLERPPAAVVEAPGPADRQADRGRLLEHLRDLPPGGRVDGEDHHPVRVEAIHVERTVADDELGALRLHNPPLLVDHLATRYVLPGRQC